MFFGFEFVSVFRAFATKGVGDVIDTSITAVGTALLDSEALGSLLGKVSKDLADALLKRASQVEKKVDKLVREPLLSGLTLMRQGLTHEDKSPEQAASRDNILDHAHVALTRAWALVSDSREDSVFVRALDCVVLAAHRTHQNLAREALLALKVDLDGIETRVALMAKQAADKTGGSQSLDRFLDVDINGDIPFGYLEQQMWGQMVRGKAEKIAIRYQEERSRLDILRGLAQLAQRFADHQSAVPGHTSTVDKVL